MISTTIRERIERFVSPEPNSGCWLWTGAENGAGYGQMYTGWDGERRSRGYAHRLAYEAFRGPIPEGMELDHLCQNPGCVNPAHLQPVTQAENMRRFAARRTRCRAGHLLEDAGVISNGPRRTCGECKRISRRASYYRCRDAPVVK